MKHTVLPVILILFSLLAGCAKGDVKNVEFVIGESARYVETEIREAMDVATAHFKAEFEGCTLLTMEYSEEISDRSASGWAETYGTGEAIVLLSSFQVDDKGGDGSFNPGDTYRNWQWVLVRSNGGDWELKTWGYG